MIILRDRADLVNLDQVMSGHFAPLHSEIRNDDKYYELDFRDQLNLPRQFEAHAVVLPTLRNVIASATEHIAPISRRVVVPRRRIDKPATEQSKRLQRFYESLLTYLERQGPESIYHSAARHLCIYGISVLKFGYDATKWQAEPKRRASESDESFNERRAEWRVERGEVMPFFLGQVHPIEIIFDPFNDPPEWVIQRSQKYVYDVRNLYPEWPNSSNRRDTEKVETVEYWSKSQRAVLVNNEATWDESKGITKNRWGIVPYIIVGSGFGHDNWQHEPEHKYVGLIRFLRDVAISESRSFSMEDIVIKVSGWPIRVAEGERANEMPNLRLEFGEIQPLPPGVTIRDLSPEVPPNIVQSHMLLAQQSISTAAAPDVLQGSSVTGVRAGFDRQLMMSQARIRYTPLSVAMQNMLISICRKAAVLMERVIPGPIPISPGTVQDEFVEISKKDFAGNHAIDVRVNVLEPEDEVRKHQDAANMVAVGLMSPQTAIHKLFPDLDPQSEMARIMAARLMFSDVMQGFLSQAAAQKVAENLGLEEVLERIFASIEQGGIQSGRRPPAETATTGKRGSPQEQGEERNMNLQTMGF